MDKFLLKGKKIAEIGAGKGNFLDLASQVGLNAVGIEYDENNENKFSPNRNIILSGYPANGNQLPGAPYAGFYCINFLEHAPNPRDFLTCIHSSLEDEGVGIIEVPAFENMIEQSLSSDWIVDHLSYFDKESLTRGIEISGFEVMSAQRVWHDYDWEFIVKKRKKRNLSSMNFDFEKSVRNVCEWIDNKKNNGMKIAFWGASHQALTILTSIDTISDRDTFIIDSASFKNNKIAPGCKLLVKNPQNISFNEISAILIMAGGYASEIGNDLRNTFNFNGEISVFRGANPITITNNL